MPAFIAGAVIGAVGSLGSAYMGSRSQKDMIKEMKRQRQLATQQLKFAQEQWQHYRDTYGDIELQMVADATQGVTGDYAGVTSRAAADVEGAFAREQDAQRRQLQAYGLDPSSGRYVSSDRQFGLQKAAASALAQNTARENERQYAEDATWQRRQAIGGLGTQLIRGAGQDVQTATQNLAALHGQNAAAYGNLAGNLFANAGQFAGMAIGAGISPNAPWSAQKPATTTPNTTTPNIFTQDVNPFSQQQGLGFNNNSINNAFSYSGSQYGDLYSPNFNVNQTQNLGWLQQPALQLNNTQYGGSLNR